MSLSTHILDISRGVPAAGLAIRLLKDGECLFEGHADSDGRCAALRLLPIRCGRFQLDFATADYYRTIGLELPDPPFLDHVRIDFGISDPVAHYHVPLLLSPYSYATYRGS